MKNRSKLIVAAAILLTAALAAGLTALATGSFGSQTDPLVTLSYLNETFSPNVMGRLDKSVTDKAAELSQSFEKLINESGAASESGFAVISLANGQKLVCGVGTEIMPRVGTVVSAGGNSPRLIDETTGSSVNDAGKELARNHMYMVTINDNGVTATSSAKVLVRGTYTIE